MVENLRNTGKNLEGLLDYLEPWKPGSVAPTGPEAESAQRLLVQESAAADELIAEGDAELARDIQRNPLRRDGLVSYRIYLHISRPMRAYFQPTAEQRRRELASGQSNVLGHMAALLELKTVNPPVADQEANSEEYLRSARAHLAETRRSHSGR